MYMYVTTARAARINRPDKEDIFNAGKKIPRTIKKGERCLVFSNGTIGTGCITYNYKKDYAVNMLRELINDLERV